MGLSDNFSVFEDAVKVGLKELATGTLAGAANDIQADAKRFLRDASANLKRWGDLLAQGLLTPEEFEFLVKSQADVAIMASLAARGTTKARIGQFKRGLTTLILRSALMAIGP